MNRYTLYGLLAILIWSASVALIRSLSEQIGSLTAGAAVYLAGGAACVFWMLRRGSVAGSLRRQSLRYLLGCGALFILYMFFLYLALGLSADRHQALEVGLVNYLWPTLTILFSLVLLKKRFHIALVPATLLAIAGIVLVTTQGAAVSWGSFAGNVTRNPVAYGCALLAAVTWGLYSNLARRWVEPEADGAVQFFIPATGIVLLLLRFLMPENSSWSLRTVIEVVLMSLSTTAAYLLWELAMQKGNVVLVASFSYFTPLLSMGVSCLYLGITASGRLWVGAMLIVIGSVVSWRSVSERPVDL